MDSINNELLTVLRSLVVALTSDQEGIHISETSKKLADLSNNGDFIPAISYLVCNDSEAIVKITAMTLLRRKLNKDWNNIQDAAKDAIKGKFLNQMSNENDKKVLRSLMQLVSTIAQLDVSRGWPQLWSVILEVCNSSDQNNLNVGSELLYNVCELTPDKVGESHLTILKLLVKLLSTQGVQIETAINSIKCFKALIPWLGTEHKEVTQNLIVLSLGWIKKVLSEDETEASDLIETFELLVESEVPFIAPYLKEIVLFALEIGKADQLEDETRIRALSFISFVVQQKKKAVLKHDLLGEILKVIWPIILESDPDDDDVGLIGDESDEQSCFSSSLQIIDELALHVPPEKLFSYMLPLIQQAALSGNDSNKRGLLLTLAYLTEGTSEYIKDNHLEAFVKFACEGAKSESEKLRNAALFAIGQFAEFLEPEICEKASEVMPVIFQALQRSTSSNSMGISRAYYALENFVENLEDELSPYLEELMNYLTLRYQQGDAKEKVLVVSSLGAIGTAAKEKLMPYVDKILSILEGILSSCTDEVEMIHTQAFDTLGVFVRILGKERQALVMDSMKLAIGVMSRDAVESIDPDLLRSMFGLCAAASSVLEEQMAQYLPSVVPVMLKAITKKNDVAALEQKLTADNGLDFDGNGDLEFTDEELYALGGGYLEEKADAVHALGEMAKYSKQAFLPYLQKSFEEVYNLMDFSIAEVKKAVIGSCGQFVQTAHQLAPKETFSTMLNATFPHYCKVLVEDEERLVVMGTLYTIKEMVQAIGTDVFSKNEDDVQMLMEAVLKIMAQKSACQDSDEDVDEDDDQVQAEYDEMLIEYCGELIPVLAEKLGAHFYKYFKSCMPFFYKKMKNKNSTSERSFATGTIAETMEKFDSPMANELTPEIIPKILELTQDKSKEVRNNSVYGVGVFMQRCSADVASGFYSPCLQALSALLHVETKRFVIDNILGAVSRMILAHHHLVPEINQVAQVLISKLPLVDDREEDVTVYACLNHIARLPSTNPQTKHSCFNSMKQALEIDAIKKDVRDTIRNAAQKLVEDGIVQMQ